MRGTKPRYTGVFHRSTETRRYFFGTTSPVYAPLHATYPQGVVLKLVQKMRLGTELTDTFFHLSYNDYE
jgi:hypothetical protein